VPRCRGTFILTRAEVDEPLRLITVRQRAAALGLEPGDLRREPQM